MIRPLALSLAAGLALVTASLSGATHSVQTSGAYESFPVVHSEPITIRILNGKSGQPLAHLHLLLIGGYDQRDLHGQLFRAEALTDALGQARLNGQLANLPWLQVWTNKKPLCLADPRRASFSVERIRRDGLSSPNRCGTAVVEDAPGVFTVFVQSKEKKAPAKLTKASAKEPDSAPDKASVATSAAEDLAWQSDGAETSSLRTSALSPASFFARQPVALPPVVARVPDAAPAVALAAEFSNGAEPSMQPTSQPSASAFVRPSTLAGVPATASTAPFAAETLTQRRGAAQPSMQPSGATPVPARPSVVAGIPAVAPTAPFGPETLVQPSAAALVRPPAAAEASSPASYPPAIPGAAALPVALTKFSAKNGLATAAPASIETASAADGVAPAGDSASARARSRRSARQAEEKSKTHRARLDSQKARQLQQKAKLAPASCQPPPPAEKAARAAAWAKTEKSPATPPANAASATGPSKPAAGVKPAAAMPGKASATLKTGNPGAPPKPDKPGAPSKP